MGVWQKNGEKRDIYAFLAKNGGKSEFFWQNVLTIPKHHAIILYKYKSTRRAARVKAHAKNANFFYGKVVML